MLNSYSKPWDDPPRDQRELERTFRRVRVLRRVQLEGGRVADVGEVVRLPHVDALSLVRNKQAEPVEWARERREALVGSRP